MKDAATTSSDAASNDSNPGFIIISIPMNPIIRAIMRLKCRLSFRNIMANILVKSGTVQVMAMALPTVIFWVAMKNNIVAATHKKDRANCIL